MDAADGLAGVEVGERPRHFQHPVIGASGIAEFLAGVAQQSQAMGVGSGDLLDRRGGAMGVGGRRVRA
jgi:hypothetical protein